MANKNKMFQCLFIVVNAFRYTFLVHMHATSTKTNLSTNHNRLKNPIWWDVHQLTIYKYDRDYQKTTPVVGAELEPATSGFQVLRLNHLATLPPVICIV